MLKKRISTAATTLVRTGPGLLHAVVVNKAVATGTISIYDGIDATGTLIAVIAFGAVLLSDPPNTAIYDADFQTGLCIVTSQATDISVSFQP